jgi:hypothetical protein
MMLVLYRREPVSESMWAIPLTLCLLLFTQVTYLTPSLDNRAKRVIVDALKNRKNATREEEKIFKDLNAQLTMQRTPPPALHQVYVLLEFVKCGLLAYYAYSLSK